MSKHLITLCLCLITFNLFAQLSTPTWSGKFETAKAFIENKGQFDQRLKNPGSKILYAADQGSVQIYFTNKGLVYRFDRKEKNKDRRDGDETKPRILFESDRVHMEWQGANANAQLVAEELNPDHYTYEMKKSDKEYYDIQRIRGYKKLVYKNLYPNIDVEYIFHPQGGIKYALILHPGADPSQIKMKYADNEKLNVTSGGELFIETKFGDMVDHAPQTFYADNKAAITSSFVRNGNTITFRLGSYDNTKTIVIDPWTQTPAFANSNGVWEVDVDGSGNAYVIGGDMPMQLRKYNSTGAVQWTYNTTYDTANYWLGTMATDLAGNTYVTSGSTANIRKVSTGGALTWNAAGGGFDEYWCIAFNCDQTKLIVGGTSTGFFPPSTSNGMIFDINTNNGSVITSQAVGTNRPGFIINDISEVRSITSSKNARYYYLTLDTIGAIDDNLSACPTGNDVIFGKNHGYAFGYKSENYRPNNGNSGIKAIKANANFVYTHNGTTVHKRSLLDGSIIATATIPSGGSTATLGFNQPHNNGLDIDASGNVYVGSANGIYKYDANLTQLSSAATSYAVYDVAVNNNGEVIAVGATGNNSNASRTGYVQSFALSAAAPITLECCDANICPVGPLCSDDAAVTLTPSGQSGTWSGPGISGSGVFNPTTAGAGLHTITNTLGCGSGQVQIEVLACVALDICREGNGTLTANTGTGPYTWEHTTQIQDCSLCFVGCNFPPNCATNTSGYATFGGTGATTTVAPTGYPVRVTDSQGNTLVINSSGSLAACSSTCTLTLATSSTPATCGNANGSVTVTPTGTAPYTYSWSPGGGTSATISGLPGGNYTVTVTSEGGACNETASVTIAESGGITLSTSSTQATCGNANGGASVSVTAGTGPFTYLWSPGGATTGSITGVAAGDYTVTVNGANSCSSATTVTVTSTNAITVSASSTNTTCGNTNGTVSTNITAGTGPFTYLWSPGGATSASVTGLAGGSYTVTVTGAGGCTASGSATVAASTPLSVTPSATNANCNQANGSASVSVTGGDGSYTYSWSNGGTANSISGVATGNYDVTIDDGAGCTSTQTVYVPQNTSLTGSATGTEVTCGQTSNGSIDLDVSGGTGPYTYDWSNGATTQDLSGLTAGDYDVTVEDASGCQFLTSYTVESENTMLVEGIPQHETCKGYQDGTIDLTITGSNGPFTYLWTPGNSTTQDLSNLGEGTYSVVVTDQGNGCSTTLTYNIQAGYNFPVSITQSGDTLTATTAPNYQWYHNGVLIPNATSQTYIITEGGYFYVIVGNQNCEFTSNTIETSCICSNSIEDNSVFQGISVYPNPASEELNVVVTLTSVENASINLVDMTGRRLWIRTEKDKANNFAWKIPVADIAAGNYFVQVMVGGQTKNIKVLVKD